jgi:hypothetical protein
MSGKGRLPRFDGGSANGRYRRYPAVGSIRPEGPESTPQATLDLAGSSVHQNWSIEPIALFLYRILVQKISMIHGLRTDISRRPERHRSGGSAAERHGAGKVFREVASGAKADRPQLRRLLDQLEAGDVLTVTRLDRLARSTRDPLNTLAAITGKKAGFRSLGDAWADTTTSHGRLMLTVLGGLAEFERDLIRTRTAEGRARQGERAKPRP